MSSILVAGLVIAGILQTAAGSPRSSDHSRAISARQGGSTLDHVNGPPLSFDYSTNQPEEDNWVGVWRANDANAPGTEGDSSYSAWKDAPGSTGRARVGIDNCFPAGQYKAYLLRHGERRPPLAGPVQFNYPGNPNYKDCRGQCVPSETLCCLDSQKECNGRCIPRPDVCCPSGQKPCGGKCISEGDICCPPGQKACDGRCIPDQHVCCPSGQQACNGKCIPGGAKCCPVDRRWCDTLAACIRSADPCCTRVLVGGVTRLSGGKCWGRCYMFGRIGTDTFCEVKPGETTIMCPFKTCPGRAVRKDEVPCEPGTKCEQNR